MDAFKAATQACVSRVLVTVTVTRLLVEHGSNLGCRFVRFLLRGHRLTGFGKLSLRQQRWECLSFGGRARMIGGNIALWLLPLSVRDDSGKYDGEKSGKVFHKRVFYHYPTVAEICV